MTARAAVGAASAEALTRAAAVGFAVRAHYTTHNARAERRPETHRTACG